MGVLCSILLSHQGILRGMHCSLFLEEFSVNIYLFIYKKLSESRVSAIRMISSVGDHRERSGNKLL